MIEKWKKINSEYLVRSPWATLRVDELELPNGKRKDDYYVLEYPDWTSAVGITEEGKFILVEQYRPGADIICLEVPGGVIEQGEAPQQAAMREMQEETGYTFDTCTLLSELYPNPATSTNKNTSFLLTGGRKTHEQNLDEHELIKVHLYSLEELKQLLKDNKIPQALHVSALYYALAHLNAL